MRPFGSMMNPFYLLSFEGLVLLLVIFGMSYTVIFSWVIARFVVLCFFFSVYEGAP